jgi:membrane protein
MVKLPDWRALGEFCTALAARFYEERCFQVAASLSYTTLLSLVPAFTVALAISTAFPVFDQTVDALQAFVFENFLPDARGVDTIAEQINSFTQNAGRLTAIGTAFFEVTAILLIRTIDEALNGIFRVQRPRPVVQRVLIYWAVLTLGPALVGGSLSATSFAVGASLGWLQLDAVADAAVGVLPFLFTVLALALLYGVVPYRHVPWRHALAGAILAGVLFELAKRGFALYLVRFPTYTLIYGAFATIPIFLLWMYLSWLVVLAGATLTAMLPAYHLRDRKLVPGSDFVDALAVLGTLARAHADGRLVNLRRITAQNRLMPHRCEEILERARTLGWTVRTEKDGWVLARDADELQLRDLYRAFVFDEEAVKMKPDHLGLSLRQYAEQEKQKEKHGD